MAGLKVEYLETDRLIPSARNARTHSRKQIRQIADSIRRFGFTNPVLVDNANTILAGHGRVAAARLLEMDTVPSVRIETMSPEEKRAYVIADNKLALNAGWDEQLLGQELQALLAIDLDFDIGVTGFSISEVDNLIEGLELQEPGDPADDALPAENGSVPTCREGDIWQLGHQHRLICGNALDPNVVTAVMNGEKAEMVFTDPPYNVPIDGHVGGLGSIRHREFAMASGEMTKAEFTSFLTSAFQNLVNFSADGSIHFICMDWRHMEEVLEAGQGTYPELKNLVWVKDNGGMGTFYRSRHELIFAFKKGTAPHLNSFELGQHGRYRTNVWQYRGVNTLRTGRLDELALHPTVKPVQLIADAIKDVSRRGAIVLDLFGGSGSTLIAAEKTGRRARLVELDPIYCARIIRRWEAYAKDEAELVACGIDRKLALSVAAQSPRSPEGIEEPKQTPCAQRGTSEGDHTGTGLPQHRCERRKRAGTIPMVQAVIRSIAVSAAKGSQRAQRLFAELVASVETADKRRHDEWLETAITYKFEWEQELERRRVHGIDASAPLPHPDDIVIDMNSGLVRVTGPDDQGGEGRLGPIPKAQS